MIFCNRESCSHNIEMRCEKMNVLLIDGICLHAYHDIVGEKYE